MTRDFLINNRIKASEVRLIDKKGELIGVMPLNEALQKAQEENLDLVQISEKSVPPVCKIVDYGKFLYQQKKKEKKISKGQRRGELKEVRLGFTTSPYDLKVRAQSIEKFLKKGYKVKILMPLQGREKHLADFAKKKIEGMLAQLKNTFPVRIEKELKLEPRGWCIIISKQ